MNANVPARLQGVLTLTREGLGEAEIAERLGIARGTVKSRRSILRGLGLLDPVRPGGMPAPTVGQVVPASEATSLAPVLDQAAILALQGQVAGLQQQVDALWEALLKPARPAAGITAVVPRGGKIEQWTVRLTAPLIEAIKTQAAVRGLPPSHLVEEGMRSYLGLGEGAADEPG
jgi:sigma-70-like protein